MAAEPDTVRRHFSSSTGDTVSGDIYVVWIEAAELVFVVIPLVFLALQVRQANRLARQANAQAQSEMLYDMLTTANTYHDHVMINPEWAELVHRMVDDKAEFTPVEQTQTRAFANRLFNGWATNQIAYMNGQLDEQIFQAFCKDVERSMIEFRAAVPHWEFLIETYPVMKELPIFQPLVAGLRSEEQALPEVGAV